MTIKSVGYWQGDKIFIVTDIFVFVNLWRQFVSKNNKTADESSSYTIVDDLFSMIDWGYTMDGKWGIWGSTTMGNVGTELMQMYWKYGN